MFGETEAPSTSEQTIRKEGATQRKSSRKFPGTSFDPVAEYCARVQVEDVQHWAEIDQGADS